MSKAKEAAFLLTADIAVIVVFSLLSKNLSDYAEIHHTSVEVMLGGFVYSSLCWLALMLVGLAGAYHGLQLFRLLKKKDDTSASRRGQ